MQQDRTKEIVEGKQEETKGKWKKPETKKNEMYSCTVEVSTCIYTSWRCD